MDADRRTELKQLADAQYTNQESKRPLTECLDEIDRLRKALEHIRRCDLAFAHGLAREALKGTE